MPTDLNPQITSLFQEVIEARRAMVAAEEAYRALQSQLITIIEARKISEIGIEDNGVKTTARIVRSETTTVDEISLKKALGARTFNKVCIQRVDKGKLQRAMTDGTVDPVVVAQHTVIKSASPYLRFTTKEVPE